MCTFKDTRQTLTAHSFSYFALFFVHFLHSFHRHHNESPCGMHPKWLDCLIALWLTVLSAI